MGSLVSRMPTRHHRETTVHWKEYVVTASDGRKPGTKCGGTSCAGGLVWGTEVPQWGPGAKPR